MATYEVRDPSGQKYRITAPDSASEQEVLAYAQRQFAQQAQPSAQATPAAQPTQEPQRSIVTDFGRQLGLTARGAIQGVGGLGAMVGDALFGLIGQPGRSSRALASALDVIGLPRPENSTERVAQTVVGAMTPGALIQRGASLAQPVSETARGVATQLASNPLAQQVSTTAGSMASGTAAELGASPVGQLAAGVVGGVVAPAALQSAQQGLTQRAPRNVEMFDRAGVTPSAAQATERPFMQGLENLMSRFPGGRAIMQSFRENQQRTLGDRTNTGVSAEDAGRAIVKGVTGDGGFISRFKAQQDLLYSKLDDFIPGDTQIRVDATRKALADLNADIPGAEALSRFFKNAKIAGIEDALTADVGRQRVYTPSQLRAAVDQGPQRGKDLAEALGEGSLPYEAIKKLRSLVGREMADSTLVSDVPRSKWKALYAALSNDLGDAAKQSGKDAEMAWSRANNFTRSGMNRIENVLDRVIGKDKQPEDIFNALMPKDYNQANTLRATLRSLSAEERQTVSQALVARLGRATAGRQSDAGDVFSSETFLTNWNRLAPGAKAMLFPDSDTRQKMEAIAGVANNIREGSKAYANSSNTAGTLTPYGLGALIATGNVGPAAAMMGGALGGAKLFTYKPFVDWLASAQSVRPQTTSAHLARLGLIYSQTKDPEIRSALDGYMQNLETQIGQPANQ